MSSNAKPKKANKPSRPFTRKMGSQVHSPTYDGVYGDTYLVYAMINSMGSRCTVQVQNGDVYSGIFHTVSPKMDIVLAAAHKVDSNLNHNELSFPSTEDIIEELIFQYNEVVHIEIQNTNLSFAEVSTKSNGDAGAERKFSPTNGSEFRVLEPWDGGGDTTTDISLGGLEDTPGPISETNGWGAEEMFRTNQEQYGVKSTFNPEMKEYTTQLDFKKTPENEQRWARASKLAQEIENSPSYKRNVHLELDENRTEEEKYSSVDPIPNCEPQSGNKRYNHGRGRARDQSSWNYRHGNNFNQQNSGKISRSTGSYPGGVPGRVNTPTSHGESPTANQGKLSSKQNNMPQLPPRMKQSREDDRHRGHDNRMHDCVAPHSGYGGQSKPQRSGNQIRTTYNHPPVDSNMTSLSGHSTPQSISRDSSSSSLTQQHPYMPQWKEGDPIHSGLPSNNNNPNQSRSYQSPGARENLFSSSVPSGGPIMPSHPMQTGSSSYSDKCPKHIPITGYRQTALPAGGNAQTFQLSKCFYTPKGHHPPVQTPPQTIPSNSVYMSQPPIGNQAQPPRYHLAATTISTTTQSTPPVQSPPNRRISGSLENKPPISKHHTGVASAGSPIVSKSASTGSAGSTKEQETKKLKEFSKNFKLKSDETSTNEFRNNVRSSTSATRSRSMEEDTLRKSQIPQIRTPVPATVEVNEPSQTVMHPSNQTTLQPTPVAIRSTNADSSVGLAANISHVPAQPSQLPAILSHQQNNWAGDTQGAVGPSQPSVNLPSPRNVSAANDVVTVSAATGPYGVAVSEQPSQTTATSLKVASPEIQSSVAQIEGTKTTVPSPAGEMPNPPASDSNNKLKLNPDAKAFTPRLKPSGTTTPQSPTPVPHQQLQSIYNSSSIFVVQQNPPIHTKGQAIFNQPQDPSMMTVHPSNVAQHFQQTQAAFYAQPHYTNHPAASLLIAPSQQLGTAQPAVMPQQGPYSGVEQMIYQPSPTSHFVQPTTHLNITNAPYEYGFQHAQSIQIQHQLPSPQHQSQPPVTPQQSQATQQTASYISQQQPQQQRPRSTHTPNTGLIQPASPAANVPPQSATSMSANQSVQMHPAAPNTVSPFYPRVIATAVRPTLVSNTHHGTYPVAARSFMMFPPNQPQPPGSNPKAQSSYVSAAVVSTPNHGQQQHQNRRQYHHGQVIQGYQQSTN